MTYSHLPIREIKKRLTEKQASFQMIEKLRSDKRKGVQQLLKSWDRKQAKQAAQITQYEEMSRYELQLKKSGYTFIVGVDEVGRGSLAGPVVAAAVCLRDHKLIGLKDSKQLNAQDRKVFYEQIMAHAFVGIGIVPPTLIDKHNIFKATEMAMIQAVTKCGVHADYLLVDAMKLSLPIPQSSLVKGDQKSVSIAAASIVAKVTRDQIMKELAAQYPEYGFDRHVGYGTKEHLQAIKRYGVTSQHRQSFSPIAKSV